MLERNNYHRSLWNVSGEVFPHKADIPHPKDAVGDAELMRPIRTNFVLMPANMQAAPIRDKSKNLDQYENTKANPVFTPADFPAEFYIGGVI